MAGAIDRLVGLKENVILGHLIPAGTGYSIHQKIRVKHLVEPAAAPEREREPREYREVRERVAGGRLAAQAVASSPSSEG